MKIINNKGIALPIVILTMVVLSILGIALWNLAVSEAKQAEWQTNTSQAQYLGQSGVNSGFKILEYELDNATFNDMPTVIAHMNTLISNRFTSNPEEFSINDAGSYTITFEEVDALALKIKSIGTSNGSNKTVSLTTRLRVPGSTFTNPSDWVAGINLTHSVNSSDNYLGHGVTLEGKPIQSPQGGNVPSVFQASVIFFTDYQDLSLQQINNSVNITFDTEVLYFQTGIELNGLGVTATKNDLAFSFSDDVANSRPSGRLAYGDLVGFENVDRYISFIDGVTGAGLVDYSDYNTADPLDDPYYYLNVYPFIPGERYGAVRFGDDVTGYGDTINAGYYFYACGADGTTPISLKDSDLIADNRLIAIESDDIIIKAIDSMFKYTAGPTEPQMWDNK